MSKLVSIYPSMILWPCTNGTTWHEPPERTPEGGGAQPPEISHGDLLIIWRVRIVAGAAALDFPGANGFLTGFASVFGIVEEIANKLVVLELRGNRRLVARISLALLLLVPGADRIAVGFTSVLLQVLLHIGRKVERRANHGFEKLAVALGADKACMDDTIEGQLRQLGRR